MDQDDAFRIPDAPFSVAYGDHGRSHLDKYMWTTKFGAGGRLPRVGLVTTIHNFFTR